MDILIILFLGILAAVVIGFVNYWKAQRFVDIQIKATKEYLKTHKIKPDDKE